MKLCNSWSEAMRTIFAIIVIIIAVIAYLKVDEATNIIINDESPLQVHIAASPNSGFQPLTVTFYSVVSGGIPDTYSWSFGDGGTSSIANPSHLYASEGTYTTVLIVTDKTGRTRADSITIDVVSPSFSVTVIANPNTGKAPLQVTFSSVVNGGVPQFSYNWTFGDGSTSKIESPTHTYTSQGSYIVTLIVTDGLGKNEIDGITVVVEAPPLDLSITLTNTSGTTPLKVDFTLKIKGGLPPYYYLWDFGDDTTSNQQNPLHTFNQAGNYNVTITVTDSRGQKISATTRINVTNATPGFEILTVILAVIVVSILWKRKVNRD